MDALAEAFADAERRLKQSEYFTGNVCTAVINELRYAGCHLLRAECPTVTQLDEATESQHHDANEKQWADREIRRAIDHCRRAKYDAIAFDVHGAIEWLELFKRDYRLILDQDIVGLPEALHVAEDAKRVIVYGEANPSLRERHLTTLDQSCAVLKNSLNSLESLRFQLNAKRNRAMRNRLACIAGIVLAAAGVLVGYAQLRVAKSGTPNMQVVPQTSPASR